MNPEPGGLTSVRTLGLLAHQGGWDEILLVAVPLIVISALLLSANRKISARLSSARSVDPTPLDQSPGLEVDRDDQRGQNRE